MSYALPLVALGAAAIWLVSRSSEKSQDDSGKETPKRLDYDPSLESPRTDASPMTDASPVVSPAKPSADVFGRTIDSFSAKEGSSGSSFERLGSSVSSTGACSSYANKKSLAVPFEKASTSIVRLRGGNIGDIVMRTIKDASTNLTVAQELLRMLKLEYTALANMNSAVKISGGKPNIQKESDLNSLISCFEKWMKDRLGYVTVIDPVFHLSSEKKADELSFGSGDSVKMGEDYSFGK